jgi:hypothetical protein
MFLQTSLNWGPNFSPPNYTSWVNLVRQNAGHRDQHIVAIHFYSETHPKPLQFSVQIWDPEKKHSAWCWESTCPWPDGFRSAMKVGTSLHWKRTKGHRAKDLPDSTTPREALMWLGSLPFGCYSVQSHLFFTSLEKNQKKTQQKMQESAIESIPTNLQHLHVQQLVTQAYPGIPWCLHSKMDTGLLA